VALANIGRFTLVLQLLCVDGAQCSGYVMYKK
jgi:hypothetical protein